MLKKLVFDMSLKLVSKMEASGGSQNCTLLSSFAAVQFAHDSSSRIEIYYLLRVYIPEYASVSDHFIERRVKGGTEPGGFAKVKTGQLSQSMEAVRMQFVK